MNKNISVWSGEKTPPTKYHLWQKDDTIYVNIEDEWKPLASVESIQLLEEVITNLNRIKDIELVEVNSFSNNILKSYRLKSGDNYFGTTIDIPKDKANVSDVLLKKSASGGYYIEENSNELGLGAFAAGSECTASGMFAYAESSATASGNGSHAEGIAIASGDYSHAEGDSTYASGYYSHAEGQDTEASRNCSHAEGVMTIASGYCSHVQGSYNIEDKNAIHSVGIGNDTTSKNAEYIYVKNNESGTSQIDDPKNGYKYLIGVGGYDGISTDNSKYKSVLEVITELTAGVRALWLPMTAASGDTVAMDANKMYDITIGESLILTLNTPTDLTVTNEYQGSFDTGATAPTVTFPANVIWVEIPSVEANTHYEFNIRYTGGKYYGLIQAWNINTLEESV